MDNNLVRKHLLDSGVNHRSFTSSKRKRNLQKFGLDIILELAGFLKRDSVEMTEEDLCELIEILSYINTDES